MKINLASTQYKRTLYQDKNQFDISIQDLQQMIETPIISDTKNDAPYLYFFDLKYKKGESYAVQENATSMTMLVFDSDTGYTIEEFENLFRDYSYALYTTYSHQPTHHKFRAFVELASPLDIDILRSSYYKNWFMRKFPFQDKAILKFTGVYLPNCKSLDNYYYKCNTGKPFDLFDYTDEWDKEQQRLDKLKLIKDKMFNKPKEYTKSISVRNNKKVSDYLDCGIHYSGMGILAYTALCVAYTARDSHTTSLIIDKMELDGFNDREIQHYLQGARNL